MIFNKNDYIGKMESLLGDTTKFVALGSVANHDNTSKLEAKLQRRLLKLKKDGIISSSTYETVRPVGSTRPRMYGLPKVHKTDLPLRPILSMTGSAQHKLAKWLNNIIEPVRLYYSSNCVRDSFTFAEH